MSFKKTDYEALLSALNDYAEGAAEPVSVLANASAVLWQGMECINWAGFYMVRGDELFLGPFQGKPACMRIQKGRGVCGTAYAEDRVQLVPDVHAFTGHIACDPASRSEIVIPLHGKDGAVIGVLDIDSPEKGRFSEEDREGLCAYADAVEAYLKAAVQ